ncbi:MAG: murein L,D-transpeptidase [Bacteroidetes bacterium]|nr:MAG: murein L,D-transpeptidase [Bacteroidota bacterium]
MNKINKINLIILPIIFAVLLFLGCERKGEEEEIPLSKEQIDSIKKAEIEKEIASHDTFPKITYTQVVIRDRAHLQLIFDKIKNPNTEFPNLKVLATLNRKELRFFGVGQTIVVPDTIIENMLAYSCFPQYYPGAKNIKKIIIVTNKFQAYACYEYGHLVRFAASNTGKERTQTYPGRYSLEWKEAVHRSSLDSEWVMPFNFNFHSEAGNAFHQFMMPGRPVSHSCCRQFMDDAKWLFYWGEGYKKNANGKKIPLSGTPVVLIDHFDFARKTGGPWLDFKSNKDSVLTLPEDPMEVEEALIPMCQIPEGSRGSLRNRERYVHAEDTLRARGVIRPGVKLIVSVDYNKLRRLKELKEIRAREAKEAHKKKENESLNHE